MKLNKVVTFCEASTGNERQFLAHALLFNLQLNCFIKLKIIRI
jgi:hypothetical protein